MNPDEWEIAIASALAMDLVALMAVLQRVEVGDDVSRGF